MSLHIFVKFEAAPNFYSFRPQDYVGGSDQTDRHVVFPGARFSFYLSQALGSDPALPEAHGSEGPATALDPPVGQGEGIAELLNPLVVGGIARMALGQGRPGWSPTQAPIG